MVPIDPWRNSTPLFGAVAFCTTKIDDFRSWFKDAIATLELNWDFSFDWNLEGCKLGPGKKLLKYWAAARHSRRQLYQLYSQLDTRIWSPWNLEHDHHHKYGGHGSLQGFLTCFSCGICVLAVIELNLNTIVVKFIDIIIIIIIIIFGLTFNRSSLAVLHYGWAGQGRQDWSTW